MKTWRKPQAIWDTNTNPDHHGWLIRVEQEFGGFVEQVGVIPCPAYYDMDIDADEDDIRDMIEATAKYEGVDEIDW